MATGCAFIDYDNDGWMDIFILGGPLAWNSCPASNRLYNNNRDGTFTDVTAKAGLLDAGWAQGVCVGDYNNDGFEDLFLTYYGQNRLYRNNGDGTFTDVTAKAGLLYPGTRYSTGCTFVDYNRDGLLDLFVSNYLEIDLATAPSPRWPCPTAITRACPSTAVPLGLPKAQALPLSQQWRRHLYRCLQRVRHQARSRIVRPHRRRIDADEDGWPISSSPAIPRSLLLLMNNHDGTFREEALLRGIASQRRWPRDGRHGRRCGRLQPRRPYRHAQDSLLQPGHRASTATTARATSTT
jgi:enediyne biosynthesis protein E4